MRLWPKQIGKETYYYYSRKSVTELKSDIQQVLDKKDFSINLCGEFTSNTEFNMVPKWQILMIKNAERSVAYLEGRLFKDELGRTRVTFTVRPNSMFPILFYIFLISGIFSITDQYSNEGLELMFLIPAIMLFGAVASKQGIKDRFVKTFDLKPVEE